MTHNMRQLLLTFSLTCVCSQSIQAQTQQAWEPGTFSCVVGENGENIWQAIAGQPFDGTAIDSRLLYGNMETSSSLSEAEVIRGISLNKKTLSLEIGQSEQLSVSIDADENANRTLVWHSSNQNIASVDESGKVKAIHPGQAILTAITASGNYADECTLTVNRSEPLPEPEPIPVTDVTLNLISATLECGESLRLIATVSPADADDPSVCWETSNPAIADVDQSGLVSALSAGNATITATTNDGDLSASCEVTVNEIPTSIELTDERQMVYPRIVKEQLHLNLQNAESVYLINASGQIVRVFQAPAGESTISLSGYPVGIYWIRLAEHTVSILKE